MSPDRRRKTAVMMRIITGIARGTRLEAPKNDRTRPTTEMAKEGIFSSIQFDLEGRKRLDVFAGSGQLGLEALSRGAASCVFVDSDGDAFEAIKKNAQKSGLYPKCRIQKSEFGEYIKSAAREKARFDFIFLDPPYDSGITLDSAKRILKADLLAPGGKMFCESDKPDLLGKNETALAEDPVFAGISDLRKYKYGRTYFYCFTRKTDEAGEADETVRS